RHTRSKRDWSSDVCSSDLYFQIMPAGPNPAVGWSQGFFDAAMSMNPKPKTVALVGADAEYPAMALEGAREHAKKTGLKVVYDKRSEERRVGKGCGHGGGRE